MSFKKCKSKTLPCKAGERCPEHKNIIAYKGIHFGSVVAQFFEEELFKKTFDNQRQTLGFPLFTFQPDTEFSSSFQKAVQKNFNNDVKIVVQHEKDAYTIKDLTIKGVKEDNQGAVILSSLVAGTQHNVYSYGVKSTDITYDEYVKAGFEPNPYYWAGKESPLKGVTYPTKEEVENINRVWSLVNKKMLNNPANPLNQMKRLKKYPYVRASGGFRFLDYATKQGVDFKKVATVEQKRVKETEAASKLGFWYGSRQLW